MNGKSCPGEQFCTTNEDTGEIAGMHGRLEHRTLENYCHNKEATKSNGLKPGCPLYDTKPENVPVGIIGAIDAAESLRRYKKRGTLPPIDELTAWEYCCFDTAEEASDTIESEEAQKTIDGAGDPAKPNAPTKFGGGKGMTPLGESGKIEEGGAFSNWGKK